MPDLQAYRMRREAAVGEVFYRNQLADPGQREKYFPQGDETAEMYAQMPKIAVPITSSIVDRMTGQLYRTVKIEMGNDADQRVWDEVADRSDFDNLGPNTIGWSLVGGNYMVVIRSPKPREVTLEPWKGQYLFRTDGTMGYEYVLKKSTGEAMPIFTDADLGSDSQKVRQEFYTNGTLMQVGNGEPQFLKHNFGFIPAVWFYAPDREPKSLYAEPYPNRFKNLVVEFCQVFSQASASIKIFQNLWVNKGDPPPKGKEFRIAPNRVYSVGVDGDLYQALRALTLEPEWGHLEMLTRQITAAASVPTYYTGLEQFGKIESGYALEIMFQPLQEIMGRIRSQMLKKFRLLVERSVMIAKGSLNVPEVNISIAESFMPSDIDKELLRIQMLADRGVLDAEEERTMSRALIGLEA